MLGLPHPERLRKPPAAVPKISRGECRDCGGCSPARGKFIWPPFAATCTNPVQFADFHTLGLRCPVPLNLPKNLISLWIRTGAEGGT